MANLGLPSIEIVFKQLGTSAIERGESGVVAMVLEKELEPTPKIKEIYSASDIGEEFDAHQKSLIISCLQGGVKGINKLIVVTAQDTPKGVAALINQDFNYLVTPYIDGDSCSEIITTVEQLREEGKMIKYVVANKKSDKPFVINFTTQGIQVAGEPVETKAFTSRIAGIIASMPLSMSVTYYALPEVENIEVLSKTQINSKIGQGELVLVNDGKKVKIARGVTSVTTTGAEIPESFKKIKVLAIADLIKSDIAHTLEDSYIGKYPCDYDHKCLLVSAINSYLQTLEREMLLDSGSYCEIDLDSQRQYLESTGIKTSAMTEDQILMANTGDKVYLTVHAKILDVIEDIKIDINI